MAKRNKVELIGNLGRDPEVRYTGNGDPVANLAVATDESYKDRNTGQKVQQTEWHRVVVFGYSASYAAQYLKKGNQVFVEGKLKTRKWQGQDGRDNYTTEIVVDVTGDLQGLDRSPQGQSQGPQSQGTQGNSAQGNAGNSQQPPAQNAQNQAAQADYDPEMDHIPF